MRTKTFKQIYEINDLWRELQAKLGLYLKGSRGKESKGIRACNERTHDSWREVERILRDSDDAVSSELAGGSVDKVLQNTKTLRTLVTSDLGFDPIIQKLGTFRAYLRGDGDYEPEAKPKPEPEILIPNDPAGPEEAPTNERGAKEPQASEPEPDGNRKFMTYLDSAALKDAMNRYLNELQLNATGYTIFLRDSQGTVIFEIEHRFSNGRTIWEYPPSGHPTLKVTSGVPEIPNSEPEEILTEDIPGIPAQT